MIMIARLQTFVFNKFVFISLVIAAVLNIGLAILARLPDQISVVTRYSVLDGVEEVGEAASLLYFPIFALLTFAANIILSFFFFQRERMLALTFLAGGIIYETTLLLSILALRAVNGY